MTEPIVFVSHFRVKEDKLDGLKQLFGEALEMLEADLGGFLRIQPA